MRTSLASIAPALALSLALGACGDGTNDCPTTVELIIANPSEGAVILEAGDTSDAPGLQIDVVVRTSGLSEGDLVELVVVDEGGTRSVVSPPATVDGSNRATFSDVTVPQGAVTLEASATGACGEATPDSIAITVPGDVDCALVIREGPIENPFFAPLPVLNSTNDADPATAIFDANFDVTTAPGFQVEVFVLDVGTTIESSAGTQSANDTGRATVSATLADGRQAIRATCTPVGAGASAAAPPQTVFVDTSPPTCSFAAPTDLTITPDDDEDSGAKGIQVTLRGVAVGGDVEGAAASFRVGSLDVVAPALDAGGASEAVASFTSPGTTTLEFTTSDQAGNPCVASQAVETITDGCAIAHVTPSAPVTVDSNPGAPGVQTLLEVQVDTECVGRTVTSDCDRDGGASATVPASGLVSVEITVCPSVATCETTIVCASQVTSAAGITTSAPATIVVDNQPPGVTFDVTNPTGLVCPNISVSALDDIQGDESDGVQIQVRAVAPFTDSITIEHTTDGGLQPPIAPDITTGNAIVTLASGDNSFVARATDAPGPDGASPVCVIRLQDLNIAFVDPIASGSVGGADGTVGAGGLTLDVCGTVDEAATASVEITIDGGAPLAAVVNGVSGAWCVTDVLLSESPPAHTIVATGTSGANSGQATVDVTVDITPPDSPTDPVGEALVADSRQSATLTWTAPADGGTAVTGYIVKISDTALNDANFDTNGTIVTPPTPAAPGTEQSVTASQLRPGIDVFMGVAALDAFGNRSPALIRGPVVPDFDRTDAIASIGAPPAVPASGEQGFGNALAAGDINGDGFSDAVVGAPITNLDASGSDGMAYVYLGGMGGIADIPEFRIRASAAETNGRLGSGVAVLDWDGDGTKDVAIGAPFQNSTSGRVLIYLGGATFDRPTAGTTVDILQADADVVIETAATGLFTIGTLGASLAAARFDEDARDDLIIGMPFSDGIAGGALVVHGGSSTANLIVLSDTAPGRVGGAKATYLRVGADVPGNAQFGTRVRNLGFTEGTTDNGEDILLAGSLDTTAGVNPAFIFRGRSAPAGAAEYQEFNFDTDGATFGDLSVLSGDTDGEGRFGEHGGSIPALDGSNGRDIVITESRFSNRRGRAYVIPGDATGAAVDITTLAVLTIEGVNPNEFAGNSLANNADQLLGPTPDVDNDGQEDLVLSNSAGLLVWFGGAIPTGNVTTATAQHVLAQPAGFVRANRMIWLGESSADALNDICWADSRIDQPPGQKIGRIEALY